MPRSAPVAADASDAGAHPVTQAPVRRRTAFHTLTVSRVERLCDDAVAVSFDVPGELAGEYDFRPGQSLTLRREVGGREERRSYSICAPHGSAPRIGVRHVPGGLFSSWLVHEVQAGDRIDVMPPTGGFTPDLGADERHVLVAAGSGITPVLSIASSVLRETAATVTLLYGNRRSDTVMFADELADLKDTYPARLELVHVLSREPRESELFTGRLDAAKLRAILDAVVEPSEVDHWWLCGPYGMVRDAQQVLRERGVANRSVHQELFFVDDVPPEPVRHEEPAFEGPTSEVTVVLDGRATPLSLPRDVPVLDAAQRVRPDLPFACKGGVCGTCRARVTDGEVRMRRNFALEESEVEQGFVLTCQSLPVTDTVTVDFDS
ncbi:ring-1,2-phenylacetyl-CoA epoxidase subunit PaaE [Saccharopolyspora erythraea NRRL 2338]|uniref:Phenylacetic acid degradation NADH oxidoreductase n=2 Tax=Saccharopolyspora erythraea TaxID=1836 RepID=A4FFJ7_SACEN|nr:phenylacetic acid degradation protein [Saccharopolyspora erythraea D]PFG96543.1 ring-1,2-phenylacetyl-CoA epoxidase subunit PaaE [Saccharopolyspora erythraea NRRL 2338]CAM02822.1 putative phenylacetic acid degradation NADH oxidoreductase [Saccharopolyspora erythraea NRRL 2338]